MSRFLDPLRLESIGGDDWTQLAPMRFEIGPVGSGLMLVVKPQRRTDLASVPRIFWSFFPPDNPRYAAAADLHDQLCEWQGFSRRTADALFHEALLCLNVPPLQALVLFWAVRFYATVKGL